MTLTQETRRACCEREGILKPDGMDPHHCFFKSEYLKDDIDEEWNIEPVRRGAHDSIHQESNHKLEILYKEKALARYIGENKEELEQILKTKKSHYGLE